MKKITFVLAIVLTFAFASGLFAVIPAAASTVPQGERTERFDGDTLTGDWTVSGDAELNEGKNVLRIDKPNAWQPMITPNKYKVAVDDSSKSFDIEFDIEIVAGTGWFGICVGAPASTSHFFESGLMFMINEVGKVDVWTTASATNIAIKADYGFNLSAGLTKGTTYTFKVTGEKLTVDNAQNLYYDINLYYGIRGDTLTIQKNASKPCSADNVRASNHFGFASMGNLTFHITRFEFELLNQSDEPVSSFVENFDRPGSKISYPSLRDTTADWHLSAAIASNAAKPNEIAPESAYFIGKVKEVEFDGSKNGRVTSAAPLAVDSRANKVAELSYKLKLSDLPEGDYFGLGLGLDNTAAELDSKNMLYISRRAGAFYVGVKSGSVLTEESAVATLALGAETVLKYYIYFHAATKTYDLDFTAGAFTKTYHSLQIDGFAAVGCKTDAASSGVTGLVDDFRLISYGYVSGTANDETIDFNGTSTQNVGTEVYVRAYYNTAKWFLSGTGITMPSGQFDPAKAFLNFDVPAQTTALCAFGPAQIYGDFILRYTLQVTGSSSWVGVSLGKVSPESTTASSPYIKFEKSGDSMNVSGVGMSTDSGATSYRDTAVNFFDNTDKAYDIMIISQAGVVSVFYCEAGTNTGFAPKITFTSVATYGYLSLTGDIAAGFKYKVSALSVTNADDSYAIADETMTASNRSELELGDKAQIGFSNSYINDTRWNVRGKGIEIAAGALKFTDTNKNSTFGTVGKFGAFQLNFDLVQKSATSDIMLTFAKTAANPAGCKIIFKAGTNKIELVGLETAKAETVMELPVNIYEISGKLNIKLTVMGGTVKLFVKADNQPVILLQAPVAVVSLIGGAAAEEGVIELATGDNGNMTVDGVRVLSLSYNTDIITEHRDGSNKPPLTDSTPEPESGCGSAAGLLVLLPVLGVLLLKKRY